MQASAVHPDGGMDELPRGCAQPDVAGVGAQAGLAAERSYYPVDEHRSTRRVDGVGGISFGGNVCGVTSAYCGRYLGGHGCRRWTVRGYLLCRGRCFVGGKKLCSA